LAAVRLCLSWSVDRIDRFKPSWQVPGRLYAEPNHCVCIFVGTEANYQDYRDILGRGLPQADDVAPDYKTQANALLYGDLYDWDNLNQPDSIADYLRDYY
jgi:hypothetical protein